MMKKRNYSRICPHCRHKLSFRACLVYLIKNHEHSIICDNCHRIIAPEKDAVSFKLGINLGFFAIVIPAMIALYVFHTDFLTSVIAGLLFAFITFLIVSVITLGHLHFK